MPKNNFVLLPALHNNQYQRKYRTKYESKDKQNKIDSKDTIFGNPENN